MTQPNHEPLDSMMAMDRTIDITWAILPIEGGRRAHNLEVKIASILLRDQAYIVPIVGDDGNVADRLTLYEPVKPEEWDKKVHIDLVRTSEGKRITRIDVTSHGEGIYEIDRDTGATILRRTGYSDRKVHALGQSRLQRRIEFMRRDIPRAESL